jgi:hypothetical protein
VLTKTPQPGASFVDTTAQVGTTYYYRVSAMNTRSEIGIPGPAESVRVGARPPSPPQNVTVVAKPTRVSISWDAPPEPNAGYVIERGIADEWVVANQKPIVTTRHDDAILTGAGGTLRYRVFALGEDGARSAPSAVATATLLDLNAPPTPSIASIDGSGGKVTVTARGSAGLHILRSRTRDDSGIIVNAQPLSSDTPFVDSGVENGLMYYYRAVAVDSAGNRSEPSEPRAVLVRSPQPSSSPAATARYVATPFPRVVFTLRADAKLPVALERKDEEGRWVLVAGPAQPGVAEIADSRPPRKGSVEYHVLYVTLEDEAGPPSPPIVVRIP